MTLKIEVFIRCNNLVSTRGVSIRVNLLFITHAFNRRFTLIMATFKIVVSDPKTGKSERIEAKDERARVLIGKSLGDEIEGEVIGVSGTILRITGGSDKDGFPMRPNVHGAVRKRILIGKGVGFKPSRDGERKRKTIRGNTINEDIVQINMVKQEGKRKTKTIKEEKVKRTRGKRRRPKVATTEAAAKKPAAKATVKKAASKTAAKKPAAKAKDKSSK